MNDQDKITIEQTMEKLNKRLNEIRISLGTSETWENEQTFLREIEKLDALLNAYRTTLQFLRVSKELY